MTDEECIALVARLSDAAKRAVVEATGNCAGSMTPAILDCKDELVENGLVVTSGSPWHLSKVGWSISRCAEVALWRAKQKLTNREKTTMADIFSCDCGDRLADANARIRSLERCIGRIIMFCDDPNAGSPSGTFCDSYMTGANAVKCMIREMAENG